MKTGISFIIVAMTLSPVADVLSRELTLANPIIFVVFARYLSAGIVALGVSFALRQPIKLVSSDMGGQIFRTSLLMGAMVLLVTALSIVPLANAVGGFLIAPVVASVLAMVLLRESASRSKIIGLFASFAGAYLVLRPEGSIETGALLALAGGALLGGYLVATRHAGQRNDPFSALVIQCILGAVLLLPLVFMAGFPALDAGAFGQIAFLGMVSSAAHFLTIAAFAREDALTLSPFLYFNLVVAIVFGAVWFGETPTLETLLGSGAIVLGGIKSSASADFRGLTVRKLVIAKKS